MCVLPINWRVAGIGDVARQDHKLTGEYHLIVERVNHLDRLTVEVEKVRGYNGHDHDFAHRFVHKLKSVTGVSADVIVLPPDTLPCATHKAKRVADRRVGMWG